MLHRGLEGFTVCERSTNVCFDHHLSQLAEAGSTNSKPPENGFSIGDLWSRVALLIAHVPGPAFCLLFLYIDDTCINSSNRRRLSRCLDGESHTKPHTPNHAFYFYY